MKHQYGTGEGFFRESYNYLNITDQVYTVERDELNLTLT